MEPFCGGAAIFLKKPRSKSEVINDIDGDLINLYRCIQSHPDELIRHSATLLHSRELFDSLKTQHECQLTDIQRAAKFYAINKMAFGGKMVANHYGYSRTGGAELSAANFHNSIKKLTARLDKVHIENINWTDCITRYDSKNTLFYCDPPYYGTAGYGMEFGLEQYDKMAELARSIKGRMIISVNDIEEMCQAFGGFQMEKLPIKYSVGKTRKTTFELLIKNF